MNKKRKVKFKKKNITILVIILLLLIFGIAKGIDIIIQQIKKSPEKEVKNLMKKKLTEKEIKLQKLDNINKKIDYFNEDRIDRYIDYKNKHQELSLTQIVKDVNMNLDLKHYEDIFPARNLNTPSILVNKYYYVDTSYIPENLEPISNQYALNGMKMVRVAKEAFEKMAQAAKKENLTIIAMSTYRDYNYQKNLYDKYVKQDGKEAADTYSGRPGHSEHQTGLAVDVYNKKESYTNFHKTEESIWMNKHAAEYGFILRFPKDKVNETGYQYESWHFRYVGVDAAKFIKENNISFEEYYATKIKNW